jgi:hypothetical protein
MFLFAFVGFCSAYTHENLDVGWTTYGWAPDENHLENISLFYDYDLFPTYNNFNYSINDYYIHTFGGNRYYPRNPYINKNNQSQHWNPNWIYTFYKEDKYNIEKIWWSNPKNFTDKNNEFKIFAERYDFQLDSPKVHKLTILNNLLINDIYNNLTESQPLELKSIENNITKINNEIYYLKNNNHELTLKNKNNKSSKFTPLDRLYITGDLDIDYQNTKIFLNSIYPVHDKISINGDVAVNGKICDENGCIGDNTPCNNTYEAVSGSWCGLCGDNNINVETCEGYNVCEKCPEGYTKKSFSHLLYIDSKVSFTEVTATPKNDYICIKD